MKRILPFLYLGGRVERTLLFHFPGSVAYTHGLWDGVVTREDVDHRDRPVDPHYQSPMCLVELRVGGRARFSFVLPW
jgi:hypothetical protein